ncbi:MAG: hypothetical protein KC964_03305 [Candidatus Omnitrophica bacterium]|nr:hypothetical protein [Candidatus Omnitrophota bacterium]
MDDEEEESVDPEELVDLNLDNLQMTERGRELAEAYGSLVGNLKATRDIRERNRTCRLSNMKEFGKRGGLCEISGLDSPDRPLLRDFFFARTSNGSKAHILRKESLLLIISLCQQLAEEQVEIDERAFATAVYFGKVPLEEEGIIQIRWPSGLSDIANRWRMFYFHHFMGVALEGMFSWLVTSLSERGVAGASIDDLVSSLNDRTVTESISEFFAISLPRKFGEMTPSLFFGIFGVPEGDLIRETSLYLEEFIGVESPLAEDELERRIRGKEFSQSQSGLAVSLILFCLTLARYTRWRKTDNGNWLGNHGIDKFLDLVPPLVLEGLENEFSSWWQTHFADLARFVLSRYVFQQHQIISYEKSYTADRCLIQLEDSKLTAREPFGKIGMGNARLGSAIQILHDLVLLEESEDGVTTVTNDGLELLREELERDEAK